MGISIWKQIIELERPGSVNCTKVWEELWSCKLPAKINFFGRKCLHGILPCYGVLANRHATKVSSCPICSGSCEDIKHTLFHCLHAREIWKRMGLWEIVKEASEVDRAGSAVLDYLLASNFIKPVDRSLSDIRKVILTMAWYIWWIRRQEVHDEKV